MRAHIFVYRGDEILVLRQASGAWWELPGGTVEPTETPKQAVLRETLEEAGLTVRDAALLREWSYINRRGERVECSSFAADAGDGDVVLSGEHAAHRWLTAHSYATEYCGESASGWVADFLAEMRTNCAVFQDWHQRHRS